MDYSCARDFGNLTDGFVNPLRTYIKATTVIEGGKDIYKRHRILKAFTGFGIIWRYVMQTCKYSVHLQLELINVSLEYETQHVPHG